MEQREVSELERRIAAAIEESLEGEVDERLAHLMAKAAVAVLEGARSK